MFNYTFFIWSFSEPSLALSLLSNKIDISLTIEKLCAIIIKNYYNILKVLIERVNSIIVF